MQNFIYATLYSDRILNINIQRMVFIKCSFILYLDNEIQLKITATLLF